MNIKVAVVGDCSTDHFLVIGGQDAGLIQPSSQDKKICFSYGEKIPIEEVYKSFGGSALNVSTNLSALDIDVNLVSFVGKDFEGREIIGHLDSNKISHDNVIIDQTTNQSFILLFKGERTVLSNHLKRNYSRLKLPKSDYIYLASAGEGCEDLISSVRASVANGSKLIFNPGSFILRDFDLFRPLLPYTSLLIINREEADELFGAKDIKDQLAKIISLGTNVAVITDGKNGAYFASQDSYFHMHSAVAKVKDSTGAGDAFAGALLGGIIKGNSLEESAKWGMVNSASVVEEMGSTTGSLTTHEIMKKLDQNKILKFSAI